MESEIRQASPVSLVIVEGYDRSLRVLHFKGANSGRDLELRELIEQQEVGSLRFWTLVLLFLNNASLVVHNLSISVLTHRLFPRLNCFDICNEDFVQEENQEGSTLIETIGVADSFDKNEPPPQVYHNFVQRFYGGQRKESGRCGSFYRELMLRTCL
ncbi:hypothetical protein Tco_1311285 [Tanacetum coccineum]